MEIPILQFPYGLPATNTVTFLGIPAVGKKITVNGEEFIMGTHFRGQTITQLAESFAKATRGALNPALQGKFTPIRAAHGVSYGTVVALYSTIVGTAGNALTLTTDDSTNISVGGATFSGGTASGSGSISVSSLPGAAAPVSSSAYEASHILKASAGVLYAVSGYNSGPAQWIQIHNSATLPANGVAPVLTFYVPTTSNFSRDFPVALTLSAGIVVCNSTTGPTKTIGAADVFFDAQVG